MSTKDYAVMPLEDYENACDAVRAKSGSSAKIVSGQLASKITAIPTGVDTSSATAVNTDILSGKTAYAKGKKVTGTMPNIGTASLTISNLNDTPSIARGYHSGSGNASISNTEKAKIIPENIASGVSILGVVGSLESMIYYCGTISSPTIPNLSNFGVIKRIFVLFSGTSSRDGTLNVFSPNEINLTSGGSVTLTGLDVEEQELGYILETTSVTGTFDGTNVYFTNMRMLAGSYICVVIGTPK